ncbi:hypothetical protein [Streptomyces sp. H27-D2]|uniref:hypothetical protein n=1 Tax=Streptomyces sp. H27-D2 TaxID=3046304 RepID=UPI002DBB247B|nr:hypothetical protein [Streptomyces sp. H27-D2]MEC4016403.1 hypothetical protein [Streptomyces sp. H27-D2]
MAGSSGGPYPPESGAIETVTWIERGEYERVKEKAFLAASTITGLKGDITFLKAEISGLAAVVAGVNFIKVDYSFLKVDEKGISWRGKSLYTTKSSDEKKHLGEKIAREERRAVRKIQAAEARITKLAEARESLKDSNKAVRDLESKKKKAENLKRDSSVRMLTPRLAAAKEEAEKDLSKLKKISQSAEKAEAEIAKHTSNAKVMRDRIKDLAKLSASSEKRLKDDYSNAMNTLSSFEKELKSIKHWL